MTKFYQEISNEEYHAHPSLSRSGLMMLKRSPRHFKDYVDGVFKREPTPQMIMGSAVHSLVLEKDFNDLYCSAPDCDRRTKEGKEIYNEFLSHAEGKIVLSNDMHSDVMRMGQSVFRNEEAVALMKDGLNEKSIFFKDSEFGIDCKCRPDSMNETHVVDLKTTSDASPESFGRQIAEHGYHIQAAMIQDGIFRASGNLIKDFFFVCVENKAPFYTAVYRLDDEALRMGGYEFRKLLSIYKKCLESESWESYECKNIDLPMWYKA